jgi:hypothetical protein
MTESCSYEQSIDYLYSVKQNTLNETTTKILLHEPMPSESVTSILMRTSQPHYGPGDGTTQPLTEMSTRNLSGGKGRPVRGADNLTAICEPIM